jgi:uncharacterized SAM-binding protein YcdF (DUF218 family)
VYPLGAAILVGATALLLSFTRWRHIGQVLLGVVVVVLWIAATPGLANWLNWRLASQFPHIDIDALPESDVVILLGGAADSRILYALRIYRAGKAPRILLSGGNLPWLRAAVPEAQQMANLLIELGAPPSALILETKSQTTRENAVDTAAVLREHGWRSGLLVTSEAHMPRALAAFQKVGLDVVPAAMEIDVGTLQLDGLLDLLPNAHALAGTTSAIKEMIGLWIYRLHGWT